MKITKQDLDLPHKQFIALINTHLGRETTIKEGLHPNPNNSLHASQKKGGLCPPTHQHLTNNKTYYYIAHQLEQQRIPTCSIMIHGEKKL